MLPVREFVLGLGARVCAPRWDRPRLQWLLHPTCLNRNLPPIFLSHGLRRSCRPLAHRLCRGLPLHWRCHHLLLLLLRVLALLGHHLLRVLTLLGRVAGGRCALWMTRWRWVLRRVLRSPCNLSPLRLFGLCILHSPSKLEEMRGWTVVERALALQHVEYKVGHTYSDTDTRKLPISTVVPTSLELPSVFLYWRSRHSWHSPLPAR